MNQFEVIIRLTTYSDQPEDWLIDTIDAALEKDESIDSIHTKSISPVWIRDMMFSTKEDALLYCKAHGFSPTLIHHEPTNAKK